MYIVVFRYRQIHIMNLFPLVYNAYHMSAQETCEILKIYVHIHKFQLTPSVL